MGVSNRHVHLSEPDLKALFGPEASLSVLRNLSQPGQFVAGELVQLAGPNGAITKVRVLGPTRPRTQVEISLTDAYRLGLKPPVRDSGDLDGTPGAVLIGPVGTVVLKEGVILAARHLHAPPDQAQRLALRDRQLVDLVLGGPRGGIMRNVLVRVNPSYLLELHVDTDEANAFLLRNGDAVHLLQDSERAEPGKNTAGEFAAKPAASDTAVLPPLGLVTERDVVDAAKRGGSLIVRKDVLVTPLAGDTLRTLRVALIPAECPEPVSGRGESQ